MSMHYIADDGGLGLILTDAGAQPVTLWVQEGPSCPSQGGRTGPGQTCAWFMPQPCSRTRWSSMRGRGVDMTPRTVSVATGAGPPGRQDSRVCCSGRAHQRRGHCHGRVRCRRWELIHPGVAFGSGRAEPNAEVPGETCDRGHSCGSAPTVKARWCPAEVRPSPANP